MVLSGPEPQRSILEQRLLEQAIALPRKFIFIRGKTQSREQYFVSENVEVVSYLTSKDLNEVLMASKVLVCRSGYSSIMDLTALGKKALLIPNARADGTGIPGAVPLGTTTFPESVAGRPRPRSRPEWIEPHDGI